MVTQSHNRTRPLLLAVAIISTGLTVTLISQQRQAAARQNVAASVDQYADVVVTPIQIDQRSDGIALVDRQNQTICIYRYSNTRGLELLAGRSYRYDRHLEDYNTPPPGPSDIQKMLQRDQGMQQQGQKEAEKGVLQPKIDDK